MKTTNYQELEKQIKTFADRHFEKPSDCRNQEQIRFYINELCDKIREFEARFQYVPQNAYSLLNQYNTAHNSFVAKVFQSGNC